jgi:predicted transcriptional regulator
MMTPAAMRRIRARYEIGLLELAAQTGLPGSYLERIEAGDYPALENDLARIEKALRALIKFRSEDER